MKPLELTIYSATEAAREDILTNLNHFLQRIVSPRSLTCRKYRGLTCCPFLLAIMDSVISAGNECGAALQWCGGFLQLSHVATSISVMHRESNWQSENVHVRSNGRTDTILHRQERVSSRFATRASCKQTGPCVCKPRPPLPPFTSSLSTCSLAPCSSVICPLLAVPFSRLLHLTLPPLSPHL